MPLFSIASAVMIPAEEPSTVTVYEPGAIGKCKITAPICAKESSAWRTRSLNLIGGHGNGASKDECEAVHGMVSAPGIVAFCSTVMASIPLPHDARAVP